MSNREHQLMLETLYSKNQLLPRVREEFIQGLPQSMVDTITGLDALGIKDMFCLDALCQMALHKRADVPTMVGLLRHYFDGDCQKTADALGELVRNEFFIWNDSLRLFIVIYELTPAVWQSLEMFQYPLPMVIEPAELKTNLDNPYLTVEKKSVILNDNHHNGDVCLDHLNRMNKIRLKVNRDVVDTIHNSWKHLDKQRPGEDFGTFKKRQRAFDKYDRTARKVIDIITEHGNEFYLTHNVDKRGRTYCAGYHINHQGNSWNKAAILFANEEVTV